VEKILAILEKVIVLILSPSPEPTIHVSHPNPLLVQRSSSRPERPTSSPNLMSMHDVQRAEWSPQPAHGTTGMSAMHVPSPVMRPVDPRPLNHGKRTQTVSACNTFDTHDPLQDPTRKRHRAPQAFLHSFKCFINECKIVHPKR
jgi:hypothetical protein